MTPFPKRAQEICEHQGWDDFALVQILSRFISEHTPAWEERLTAYFETQAAEENSAGYPPPEVMRDRILEDWVDTALNDRDFVRGMLQQLANQMSEAALQRAYDDGGFEPRE